MVTGTLVPKPESSMVVQELPESSTQAAARAAHMDLEPKRVTQPKKRVADTRSFRTAVRNANRETDDICAMLSRTGITSEEDELLNQMGNCGLSKKRRKVASFGKKGNKQFIQQANARSKRKHTQGSFRKWCKSRGLVNSQGKVTRKCINAAKRSGSTKLVRKAVFAQNIGAYAGSNRFGKKISSSLPLSLKQITKMMKTIVKL